LAQIKKKDQQPLQPSEKYRGLPRPEKHRYENPGRPKLTKKQTKQGKTQPQDAVEKRNLV